jgi:hypothetical protein
VTGLGLEERRAEGARRSLLFGLLFCAAAGYGFAVFLALFPLFSSVPAPRNQVPGFLSIQGLDANAPFRAMAALLLLPGLVALLFRPLAVRYAATRRRGPAGWRRASSPPVCGRISGILPAC